MKQQVIPTFDLKSGSSPPVCKVNTPLTCVHTGCLYLPGRMNLIWSFVVWHCLKSEIECGIYWHDGGTHYRRMHIDLMNRWDIQQMALDSMAEHVCIRPLWSVITCLSHIDDLLIVNELITHCSIWCFPMGIMPLCVFLSATGACAHIHFRASLGNKLQTYWSVITATFYYIYHYTFLYEELFSTVYM